MISAELSLWAEELKQHGNIEKSNMIMKIAHKYAIIEIRNAVKARR